MNNFDFKKYLAEGKLLSESPLMATNLKEVAYALGTARLDIDVYDRIDGLTNIKLLQELLDKAILIQDDQLKAGDEFFPEDLALYLGMKILDVLK
jgi:hypothetical protein